MKLYFCMCFLKDLYSEESKRISISVSALSEIMKVLTIESLAALESKGITEVGIAIAGLEVAQEAPVLNGMMTKIFDEMNGDWAFLIRISESSMQDFSSKILQILNAMDPTADGVYAFPENNMYLVPKTAGKGKFIKFHKFKDNIAEAIKNPYSN